MDFEREREEFITKLEKLDGVINRLLDVQDSYLLLGSEDSEKLKQIKYQNLIYLNRLRENRFEIAIVGLEKAGKSTFANALIENSVLPSALERCTFTSTKIEYSDKDMAIVSFYTKDEFNTIFTSMLKDINYPNYSSESFETLDIEKFRAFFGALEDSNIELFKNHHGKTDEEIIDILRWKNDLILTGEEKLFSGEDLNSENFKEYIKGRDIKKYDSEIDSYIKEDTDTSKPRSVKNISIKSTKLINFKNVTIFDVPGFDSPTHIHERQTVERLKNADAIILVVNLADKPNINSPQLKTLRNESDYDGIKLNDKLFVFGNQIDKIQEEDKKTLEATTKKLKNILLKEVSEKYSIAKPNRLFFGSAKAFLSQKSIIKDSTSYVDSGISQIRDELVKYFESERFFIVKSKILKNEEILKKIFNSFLDKNMHFMQESQMVDEKDIRKIQESTSGIIRKRLREELRKLKNELKFEIKSEQFFSKKMRTLIDEEFKPINEDTLSEAEIYINDSLGSELRVNRLNYYLRDNLHSQFLDKFTQLILDITDVKSEEVQNRLVESFVNAVGLENDNPFFLEVFESAKAFIQTTTGNVAHSQEKFLYLIERFARDIFDVLILNPLGTDDRFNKFMEEKSDFFLMDTYYRGDLSLINMIITQKHEGLKNGSLNIDIERVTSIFYNIIKHGENLSKLIKKQRENGSLNLIADGELSLETLKDNCIVLSEEINSAVAENINFEFDAESLADSIKQSKTREEIVKEINSDIENLKIILKNIVIRVISLDKTFLTSIDRQIKIIINSTDVDSNDSDMFNDFISENIKKIKFSEYQNIYKKKELHEATMELSDAISALFED